MNFLITMMLLGITLGLPSAWAETVETVKAPVGDEQLVDIELSTMETRVNDLERRLQALERDRKFSEDKIRSLERQVNDLRRRRV